MEKIGISRFRARLHAILEEVRGTGNPILITRFGEPLVEIVPPSPAPRPKEWLGCMEGTGEILGEIVAPASDPPEWGVLRD